MTSRQIILAVLSTAFAALFFSSCASPAGVTTGGVVTKVKYQHLDPSRKVASTDKAIPFETKFRNYGALHPSEKEDREGHYYAAFWEVNDMTVPTTVRLEYRQTGTRNTVHSQEVTVQPSRRNVTHFQVTGDAYSKNGAVSAHRVLVIQRGKVVASHNSFLWK